MLRTLQLKLTRYISRADAHYYQHITRTNCIRITTTKISLKQRLGCSIYTSTCAYMYFHVLMICSLGSLTYLKFMNLLAFIFFLSFFWSHPSGNLAFIRNPRFMVLSRTRNSD